MKIRERIAAGALAVGLLTAGFSTVGQVATTQDSAEAYTIGNCYNANPYYGPNRLYIPKCYYYFNWWERSWLGGSHVNGWYFSWQV